MNRLCMKDNICTGKFVKWLIEQSKVNNNFPKKDIYSGEAYFHHPKTYMEQLCKAIQPDLDVGTICVAWFRDAMQHCTQLLGTSTASTAYIWAKVKDFIFPDRTTYLMSTKNPIGIHPNRLSKRDCQSLLLGIARDYVQRAPQYNNESAANVMLWQVLYSITATIALGLIVVIFVVFAYKKYGKKTTITDILKEFYRPEKLMQATAKRSLCWAKTELRNLHVKPLPKREDILPLDGTKCLVLKIKNKNEFLESLVEGRLQTIGKFHRLHDLNNKTKSEFKIETVNKVMKFVDNNCSKFHLCVMFEPAENLEETSARLRKSNNSSIKSLSPISPRLRTGLRLEGGKDARAISPQPRKSHSANTTPRIGIAAAASNIPRNMATLSSIFRKSK